MLISDLPNHHSLKHFLLLLSSDAVDLLALRVSEVVKHGDGDQAALY